MFSGETLNLSRRSSVFSVAGQDHVELPLDGPFRANYEKRVFALLGTNAAKGTSVKLWIERCVGSPFHFISLQMLSVQRIVGVRNAMKRNECGIGRSRRRALKAICFWMIIQERSGLGVSNVCCCQETLSFLQHGRSLTEPGEHSSQSGTNGPRTGYGHSTRFDSALESRRENVRVSGRNLGGEGDGI